MVNSVTNIKRNIKRLEFQVRQERNTAVEPLCQENEIEDEPPGRLSLFNRDNLFGHVPQASWNDWRWQFRHRITTIEELVNYIPLSSLEQDQITQVINRYDLSITPYYLCLINQKDSHDPVRIQAIPSIGEIDCIGFEDPLDEERDSRVPGLVHRYPDRVLMVLTDICPMLCRHCTRKREWKHGGWIRNAKQIEVMLEYIRNNKSKRDIIISGGDPLVLSTGQLDCLRARFKTIMFHNNNRVLFRHCFTVTKKPEFNRWRLQLQCFLDVGGQLYLGRGFANVSGNQVIQIDDAICVL